MARILLAWELGGGYGHIAKLLPLAIRLRNAGHRPALVLRDPRPAAAPCAAERLPVVVAPHWRGANPPGASAPDYAGVLALSGYTRPETVAGLVSAWRRIFASARPDLLVVNHAPTALLAARGMGFPAVAFGTGFEMPPTTRPFPSLQPWRKVSKASRVRMDARVLAIANAGARGGGAAPLDHLAQLFDVEGRFLCTFRELDHYERPGRAAHLGPIGAGVGTARPAWPDRPGPRVLVYLTAETMARLGLVGHLARLGWPAIAHVRGAPPSLAAEATAAGIAIEPEPVDLPAIAAEADLVLCHGGHGTTTQALLAGLPMVTVPQHLEQSSLAHRVSALGAGVAVPPRADPADLPALLSGFAGAAAPREAARAFAAGYAGFDQTQTADTIVARCLELTR